MQPPAGDTSGALYVKATRRKLYTIGITFI